MLCQMCLQAEATIHLVDRVPGEPPVEADYCRDCYDLKYVNPPAQPPGFPRPRFTLRGVLIVGGILGLINVAVPLVMGSGLVTGTPAQIHAWTLQAFLFANVYGLSFGCLIGSALWLQKVQWYRASGGLIPMAQPGKMAPGEYLGFIAFLAFFLTWFVGGAYVIDRAVPIVWPNWRPNSVLSIWILATPVLIWNARRLCRDEQVRAFWRGASHRERFFRIMGIAWLLLIFSAPLLADWVPLRIDPMIGVSLFIGIAAGGLILLILGAAVTTRRR